MTHVLLDMNYKDHPASRLFALMNVKILTLQLLIAIPALMTVEIYQELTYEPQDSMIELLALFH